MDEDDYTIDDNTLTFTTPPAGNILITGNTTSGHMGVTADYVSSGFLNTGSGNKTEERLTKIEEMLLIITPDLQKMEKYPALKKAYDDYKIIEALVSGENKDGK